MYIVKKVIKGITYVYEVTAYRNEEGKPRNKWKLIGKIDKESGEIIPTKKIKRKTPEDE